MGLMGFVGVWGGYYGIELADPPHFGRDACREECG